MKKNHLLAGITFILLLSITPLAAAEGVDRFVVDEAQFDDTCKPCDDFYRWATGGWQEETEIPAEYPAWSDWYGMHEQNMETLHDIMEDVSGQKADNGSPAQKIGDFFTVGMDTVKIESDGIRPLKPLLDEINSISSIRELQSFIDKAHLVGLSFGFNSWVDQDLKNNSDVIFYAVQGGLGLPDRDYYTRDDEKSLTLKANYVKHIENIFVLTGEARTSAAQKAQTILEMETRLAEASLTNVELREPEASYNLVSIKDAENLTPNFSWKKYFNDHNLGDMEKFSYSHPKFFEEFDKMMSDRPLEDWKAYLSWHAANAAANFLNKEMVDEHFEFYGKTLAGSQQLQARWKRVLYAANNVLGEVLGQLYVGERFTPEAKSKALEMIDNISKAMEVRLKNLSWMSDETKQKALTKLSTFKEKIGYPDQWRDYSNYKVKRDSYFDNMLRGWAFESQRNLDKIGKPVDRNEWGMNPQTVNAYYNPLMNEIVFPAAILQPPFFSEHNDDAANYGSMGAVIGHEISHGFDDEGSQYDADGNLKSWWTEKDREKFMARASVMIEQYNSFEALDSLHVNGELTLGENIADLAGCIIAYEGLQLALKDKPKKEIDGYTPEQRFFLAWAGTWKHVYRPEYLTLLVQSDVHSPGKFRCNGPLQNIPQFWEAFDCKKGDPMVRSGAEFIELW